MSTLRDLFHQPAAHPIAGCTFTVHRLQFSQFADALTLARFLEDLDSDAFDLQQLQQIAAGSPEREALKTTLAGCMAVHVPDQDAPRQLQPDDIEVMPALMVAEALAVVMEVNADFFFQSLPRLLQTGLRIRSTGSALLNRLSGQATPPSA